MQHPLHTLRDYLHLLAGESLLAPPAPVLANPDAPVTLVSYDSRQVVPGTLFFCKGAHFRAEFLAQARENGALAYVSETAYPEAGLPCILVHDMRRTLAAVAGLHFGHPAEALRVIGITGTKGKSTTAYYLKYILDELAHASGGAESAVISSIDTYDGVERFESHLTTPEPFELQRHFANARDAGIAHLTMEVSSQALKYHRTLGIRFAAAVFLNIGGDHISPIEHPDFEDYLSAKLRIFSQTDLACINLDSDAAPRALDAAREAGCTRILTFSRTDDRADVFADEVEKDGDDILFRVRTARFTRRFRLTMPGLFNVDNALAAIAVCQGLEIPERHVYVGLMKARVPGRMEVYSNTDGHVTAIVDYAHNRMSFESLFRSAAQEYPGRRIVSVFGCPGRKALARRRDLGEIAGAHAQLVVLTEEDSGEEDTLQICREIASHVEGQGCRCVIEPNRGEAIRQAVLSCADAPSVLLITGKGEETRQKRGMEYIETPSDVSYVKAFLDEFDLRHGRDAAGQVRGLVRFLPALTALRGQTVVLCGGTADELATLRLAGCDVREAHDPAQAAQLATECAAAHLIVRNAQVRLDPQNEKTALTRIDLARARELLDYAVLDDAAQALLRGAVRAIEGGVGMVALLDGQSEHAALLHLLGQRVRATRITM